MHSDGLVRIDMCRGFVVHYRAMLEWEVGQVMNITTTQQEATLTELEAFQNYTIQVTVITMD